MNFHKHADILNKFYLGIALLKLIQKFTFLNLILLLLFLYNLQLFFCLLYFCNVTNYLLQDFFSLFFFVFKHYLFFIYVLFHLYVIFCFFFLKIKEHYIYVVSSLVFDQIYCVELVENIVNVIPFLSDELVLDAFSVVTFLKLQDGHVVLLFQVQLLFKSGL